MIVLRRVLMMVIVAELAGVFYLAWGRLRRVDPPVIDPRRLDPVTAGELQELRLQARDGALDDWRTLGEAYLGSGYYIAAEQCFRHVAALGERDVQALYAQGFCLERTGQTTEAIGVFRQVIERGDPELAQTCSYQIGRCHLREENAEAAEEAFRQIPDFPPAAYQLAKLLIRSGRPEEAVPVIDRVLPLAPNALKMLQLRMRAAAAMDDAELVAELRDREDRAKYELALEYGQRFITMFASRIGLSALLSRAMQLRNEGTLKARQAALRRPLQIVLDHQLWQYRSVILAAAHVELGLGNLGAARRLLELMEEETRGGIEAMELRALLEAAEGHHQAAYELWTRIAAMKPSMDAYLQLANTGADIDEAARQRHLAQAHLRAGLDALQNNDPEQATHLLAQCDPWLSNDALYWFYVGETHRLLGRIQVAMEAYEKCLAVNPDHGRCLETMRQLREDGTAEESE